MGDRPRETAVRPIHKVALILCGYFVCFLVASAAFALRVADTSGPASQAAGGMYGFGDATLFVAVFGLSALVPTGAALFFLRPYRPCWVILSALGLALAVTGVTAAILFTLGRGESASHVAAWAQLSLLRILVSPLMALAFLACAVLSPHRGPRLAFLAAAAVEMAVSAYAGAVWLVPLFLHGLRFSA